jgi:Domain of unknown function (DUF4276)
VHLEVLAEEPSAEQALRLLLPRILGNEVTFTLHPFQGKPDLLRKLPDRLRAYAHWINGTDTRIVVLVDEDRQDCEQLKARLEEAAAKAGLTTKSLAGPGEPFVVLNRLAVEELEAWFFGDCVALRAAYPGVPATLERIAGETRERLEQVLQKAGYHLGGPQKIVTAIDIATHMDPARNTSPSFRQFCAGLHALVAS